MHVSRTHILYIHLILPTLYIHVYCQYTFVLMVAAFQTLYLPPRCLHWRFRLTNLWFEGGAPARSGRLGLGGGAMFQRNGLSCLVGLRLIEFDRWSVHFRIFCREYDISWWEFLIRKTIEYQWDGVCFCSCSRPVRQRAIPLAAVVLGNAPTFGPVSLSLTRGRHRTLQSTDKSRGSFSTEALVPSRAGKSQADFMPRPDTLSELVQISLVLRI